MRRAEECRFTKEHEWVSVDGDEIVVGVTDFAQKELGEIVYVDLKEVGTIAEAGGEIGTVESVKAVAEVYAPVSGKVVAANPLLEQRPEVVNEDPLGEGWLVRMHPEQQSAIEELMTHDAYAKFLEESD